MRHDVRETCIRSDRTVPERALLESVFHTNPDAKIRLLVFHDIPVLYVDEFYADPEAVRAVALRLSFVLRFSRYPGRQAIIPTEHRHEATLTVAALASRLGDFWCRGEDIDTDFSIVALRRGGLLPEQRHPHVDDWPLFGLLYLTPGSREGTSLFYSVNLRSAVIRSEEQRRLYDQFLRDDTVRSDCHPDIVNPQRYWRLLHTIEPVFNRLVIFPGNVFHNIDVQSGYGVRETAEARLTQRFIIRRLYPKA
jgi:hypothetical protein